MTVLDIVLFIILFLFVATGFRFGLIHTLGALVGTVVGVFIAGHYFEQGAELLNGISFINDNLARIIAFIIIFIIAARLVGIVFWVIDKAFNLLAIIPLLKPLNRLAGAVVGFIEGAVVLGIVLIFMDKFPYAETLVPAIQNSQIALWLLGYGKILAPLLPEAVKLLESHVNLPIDIPDVNIDPSVFEGVETRVLPDINLDDIPIEIKLKQSATSTN